MTDEQHDSLKRTKAIDDFLKAVYFLQRQTDRVSTTDLAQTLQITAPSVTDMVKRLAGIEDDKDKDKDKDKKPKHDHEEHREEHKIAVPLLEYKRYSGVRLSPAGEKIALEVIRHHRLIELYLVQALGYSWDEVHEEADRLEHHISEKLEARIAAALGNPKIDPHGDPIPALDGTILPRTLISLADLTVGQEAVVSQIVDQSADVLRFLSDLGLTPGTGITLSQRSPLNDMVSIKLGEKVHTISMQVAQMVLVTPQNR
ncbi:MAG: metal-dependent transcriptional regulator [Chloroflexota bacterium]